MRAAMGIPADSLAIVHVGSFTYPKNHSFILETACALKDQHKNFLVILVGDGPQRQEIESSASAKGLTDSCLFTGVREDIADILQAADLFIMPSHYEGFPLTLVEAQAAGLPCLVSDKITRKSDLTGLVEYVDISRGVSPWVDRIRTLKPVQRENTTDSIITAGYSITHAARELQEIYDAQ
jgi:glycosyltransferase involved in cell wall biosynthesis